MVPAGVNAWPQLVRGIAMREASLRSGGDRPDVEHLAAGSPHAARLDLATGEHPGRLRAAAQGNAGESSISLHPVEDGPQWAASIGGRHA